MKSRSGNSYPYPLGKASRGPDRIWHPRGCSQSDLPCPSGLGGTAAIRRDEFLTFRMRQLNLVREVLLAPGNHEIYHYNWPDTITILNTFEEDVTDKADPSLGEFILVDRASFRT